MLQLCSYIYNFQTSAVTELHVITGITWNSKAEKNETAHVVQLYPLTCDPESLPGVPKITCKKNQFNKVWEVGEHLPLDMPISNQHHGKCDWAE